MSKYTKQQLETQRRVWEAQLTKETNALSRLHKVHADVRENHRRTINMRIAGYTNNIAKIDADLAAGNYI